MAKSQVIYEKPWTDDFREFFDLCAADWAPPETLRVVSNPKRTRMTVSGIFTKPSGAEVRLSCRMRQYADGSWVQLEEKLEMRMVMRMSGGAA